MAFSWKRPGGALSIVAVVAMLIGIGYFWSRDVAKPELSPGGAAARAYTSPCVTDTPPLPGTPANAGNGARETTLRIASLVPQNSHHAQSLMTAATDIKEQTDGRVVMKFQFGGVHGDAGQILRKMRIGMLQGATFSATELAEHYPDIALYGLPFLFRTADEVAYVRKTLDSRLHEGLREAGFATFCIASAGFSHFMSTAPIRSRVDLLGRKVWVPEGDPVGFAFMRAAGGAPSPLSVGDVLTGLQTQLLDVTPATPLAAVFLQWHTKLDHLTRLSLQYRYGLLAVDRRAFSKIATDDQRVVGIILNSAFRKFDSDAWHSETEALLALQNSGMTMVDPDPEWIEQLRKLGDDVAVQLIQDGKMSSGLYNQARALLEEYRASN